MADNVNDFSSKLTELTKKIPQEAMLKLVRYFLLTALRGVVFKSPVGNPDLWKHKAPRGYVGGQFRGNWSLSMGGTVGDVISQGKKSGDQVVGQLANSISGIQDPFQKFYLINNLPYALKLEHGWSTQAPGPDAIVGSTAEEIKSANPNIFK